MSHRRTLLSDVFESHAQGIVIYVLLLICTYAAYLLADVTLARWVAQTPSDTGLNGATASLTNGTLDGAAAVNASLTLADSSADEGDLLSHTVS